jgi:thiamine biosynthesis lipoprotein
MASDCELLIEGVDEVQALALLMIAAKETWRIEHKFSRYVSGNIIDRINTSLGQPVEVDPETASLLNFSEQCFQLSDGLFDITSGVLRKIWHFDGSEAVPSSVKITEILRHIGWHKVDWQAPKFGLPREMELDLGGIGKEYAVDRVVLALNAEVDCLPKQNSLSNCRFVVNFGGDLACSGPRLDGSPWTIGVENSEHDQSSVATVSLSQGAVATSGDSRRYLLKDGIRYSHILNPLTGKSIIDAPHAISVAAPNCMQAGMLSTFAMLHGEQAEAFLQAQDVQYWVQR